MTVCIKFVENTVDLRLALSERNNAFNKENDALFQLLLNTVFRSTI